MYKKKNRKLSKKEQKALDKVQFFNNEVVKEKTNEIKQPVEKKIVEIPNIITVREYSAVLNLPVTKVIAELMKNGVMASINESIDFETATIIGDELGFEIKEKALYKKEIIEKGTKNNKKLKIRPPVVVVMGHVDHGKTTLLDTIRKTEVAAKESGGITQHVGAYQVNWKNKDKKTRSITFLDTPGHEAFSTMRAHGASATDIAILVVAADDGVKPQTKEAISHAKAANIPIVVAINKIDKPEADPERVKRELSDLDLIPEEWGGKTIMVPISAKNGKNINELLDIVIMVADLDEIKADYQKNADGVVIESHMQSGIGPIATLLVKNGILKTGQVVITGESYGKIRFMEDFQGRRITEAKPSQPVRIAGLHDVSNSGDIFEVVDSERTAKNRIASKIIKIKRFGLSEISEEIREGKLKELNIIIKADVQGSLEAIVNSLTSIGTNEIKVKILSASVGNISESDVNLALASKALIIGFKVATALPVKKLADEKGVKISNYDIIYNLIDDITAALEGMIEPETKEEIVGKLEVLKVFYSAKNTKIVGGKVIDGKLLSGLKVHLLHSGESNGDGKIISLKLEQNPVSEVLKGFECGVQIDSHSMLKPKDVIIAYEIIETTKKVVKK